MPSAQQQRKKFKTSQDWNDFIGKAQQSGEKLAGQCLLDLRKACYNEIEEHRGRPLLVYATKFMDSLPAGVPNFMTL